MKVKTKVMAKVMARVMARDGIWWEGQENQEKASGRFFLKKKAGNWAVSVFSPIFVN